VAHPSARDLKVESIHRLAVSRRCAWRATSESFTYLQTAIR
jgi:hypothetical protein